jgi:hypothetical protein
VCTKKAFIAVIAIFMWILERKEVIWIPQVTAILTLPPLY